MRNRAVGMAAFAGVAVGGAALGYLAERKAVKNAARSRDDGFEPLRGDVVEVVGNEGNQIRAEVNGLERAPTVILAHGVGLSSAVWHFQRTGLSGDFRVVAYDHRGHGGSERAQDYSVESLAHDLAAVIEQAAPDGPVVLVGHSMGGIAILSLAEHYPGLVRRRVAGAVLCNTTSAALIGGAAASSLAAVLGIAQARLAGSRLGRGTLLRSHDPDSRPSTDLSYLLTRQFGMTRDAPAEIVDFLEAQLRACPPIVLAGYAPGLATVNLRATAKSLDVPALVIVGGSDRVTLPQQGRRLAGELPRGKLLELEGVGHSSMLEEPESVTEAVRGFAATYVGRQVA